MSEDKVIALKNPGTPAPVADALTEILRAGAQRMLAAAIEAEVAVFLDGFMGQETAEGRQRLVPSARADDTDRCGGCGSEDAAGSGPGEGDPV